ncbi:NTF2-like protein [Schizopora paradoxa]|uniref:NTF2-like protein n=1 Tax=Schizopora paradoxa TaxID=27342 RepID=A0A0H2SEC3_9AGAM|nr:NTF2-like protein [Schizopora paradoxa]
MAGLERSDIDIATRGAEQFVEFYYRAYDSDDRVESLPKFYRPSSSIVWNGNPIQGNEGVKQLIEGMPRSKHEVQLHDCHPVPNSMPPSLHVVVAGTVTHGKAAQQTHPTSSKAVDEQPRVFHQTFILSPDAEKDEGGHVKYYITTDNMRFVG